MSWILAVFSLCPSLIILYSFLCADRHAILLPPQTAPSFGKDDQQQRAPSMCINMKLSTNWNLLEGGTIQYACTKSLACSLGRRIWTKSHWNWILIRSIHSNSKWTIASGVIYDVRDAVCWDGRSPSTVFRGFVHSVRTDGIRKN